MTATLGAATRQPEAPVRRGPRSIDVRLVAPSLVAALNGIAFFLVRPDVNDLWAARARASAVSHGVGLTYWFSWFGGGSTPGNYSVLTPYLCAYLGTELVGALAAVAVTVLATLLVRDTRHPVAAAGTAALAAGINLWSGRVPFLLGAAVAVGALIALRHRRRGMTIALTLLSILASPLSGAFLALGLSGTFLTTRTKNWRPIIAYAVGAVAIALVAVGLVFGAPGPEPFSTGLAAEVLAGLALLYLARPPDHLRTTIWVTALATVVLWAVPNGLGSNVARFVWFCLPVAVVALSRRRSWVVALAVAPLLVVGASSTLTDLENAVRPVSSVGYYAPLAARLDSIAELQDYRVEVVNHGAHAGYDALLGHASLARGWETQEDNALNKSLATPRLDPVTYKVWLDNNAVGYVALPLSSVGGSPEYTLVQHARAGYLHRIWSGADWQLFRVGNATPIVARPATITAHTQSSMTISVPCACIVGVRVRWSKFLGATRLPAVAARGSAAGRASGPGSDAPEVSARVTDDGSGWTTITTTRPGSYRLSGSIGGLLR